MRFFQKIRNQQNQNRQQKRTESQTMYIDQSTQHIGYADHYNCYEANIAPYTTIQYVFNESSINRDKNYGTKYDKKKLQKIGQTTFSPKPFFFPNIVLKCL